MQKLLRIFAKKRNFVNLIKRNVCSNSFSWLRDTRDVPNIPTGRISEISLNLVKITLTRL